MTDANGSGKAPTEAELQAMAQQHVVDMLVAMISGLSTAVGRMPQERVLEVCGAVFRQQEALGQVLEDAVDPAKRAAHGDWGVKITHRVSGSVGMTKIPKDFAMCKTLEQVSHYALVLGLVSNPTVRALLTLHGLEVTFFQAKADDGPKIITS